jgi:hypothetical protein
MTAGLASALFWAAPAGSPALAFVLTTPRPWCTSTTTEPRNEFRTAPQFTGQASERRGAVPAF